MNNTTMNNDNTTMNNNTNVSVDLKISTKASRKTLATSSLYSDDNTNVRNADNYDLTPLVDSILTIGRITNPLIVEETEHGRYLVLQGNRRLRAVQAILARADVDVDTKKELSRLDCVVYPPLSSLEREVLVNDHNSHKSLNREETVRVVWRLYAQGLSFDQIAQATYNLVAQFGDLKKAREYEAIVDAEKRRSFLKSWLNGTLGQMILGVLSLPKDIQEQFLLTCRQQDGGKVTLYARVDRARIMALNAALKKGGEAEMRKLWEQYHSVDTGVSPSTKTDPRWSVKEASKRASLFASDIVRDVIAATMGDPDSGSKLPAIDLVLSRNEKVKHILLAFSRVSTEPKLTTLLTAIVGNGDTQAVTDALLAFGLPMPEELRSPAAAAAADKVAF
jgi:ParB-like chromosome segregation protein Spo0J